MGDIVSVVFDAPVAVSQNNETTEHTQDKLVGNGNKRAHRDEEIKEREVRGRDVEKDKAIFNDYLHF